MASQPALLPEDRARADQYALLARLFYRGPDEALLGAIAAPAIEHIAAPAIEHIAASAIEHIAAPAIEKHAASVAGEHADSSAAAGDLRQAWAALASAASQADCVALQQEYDRVFVGTGKAPVTPYASFYLSETGREKVLVRLRDDLSAFGLARAQSAAEPEDHFAALFEVMRHLALAGSDGGSLALQQQFFKRYIEGAYPLFCDATMGCESAVFYSHVARYAKTFLSVDGEAMLMV